MTQSSDPRQPIGTWLRVRANHLDDQAQKYLVHVYEDQGLKGLLIQLANDAQHSDLLTRLYAGDEPYPKPTDVPWRKRYEESIRHA